jgi:hypothetical protein
VVFFCSLDVEFAVFGFCGEGPGGFVACGLTGGLGVGRSAVGAERGGRTAAYVYAAKEDGMESVRT